MKNKEKPTFKPTSWEDAAQCRSIGNEVIIDRVVEIEAKDDGLKSNNFMSATLY